MVVRSLIKHIASLCNCIFFVSRFLQLLWFYSHNSLSSSAGFLLILPHKLWKMPTIIKAY